MPLDIGFNEERYVKLLTNLIGETKLLQDNPPRFIPEEDRYEIISVYRHFHGFFCHAELSNIYWRH